MAAHVVLKWVHRVFSNFKRWALGMLHGLRRAHLRRYLDEFVFRWSRRRHTAAAFNKHFSDGHLVLDQSEGARHSRLCGLDETWSQFASRRYTKSPIMVSPA